MSRPAGAPQRVRPKLREAEKPKKKLDNAKCAPSFKSEVPSKRAERRGVMANEPSLRPELG